MSANNHNKSVKLCSICLDPMTLQSSPPPPPPMPSLNYRPIKWISCGHCFHADCIGKWFSTTTTANHKTCPMCRQCCQWMATAAAAMTTTTVSSSATTTNVISRSTQSSATTPVVTADSLSQVFSLILEQLASRAAAEPIVNPRPPPPTPPPAISLVTTTVVAAAGVPSASLAYHRGGSGRRHNLLLVPEEVGHVYGGQQQQLTRATATTRLPLANTIVTAFRHQASAAVPQVGLDHTLQSTVSTVISNNNNNNSHRQSSVITIPNESTNQIYRRPNVSYRGGRNASITPRYWVRRSGVVGNNLGEQLLSAPTQDVSRGSGGGGRQPAHHINRQSFGVNNITTVGHQMSGRRTDN